MLLFRRLNLIALALCFVVVVLGAYVRLSHAGLGCPDWPGCYGHLTVPDQHVPGYERPLEVHKAWKEMIHRYFASTLGLLIVAMAGLSVIKKNQGIPRVLPWALVALVIFQGVLGMWTVTWQLKPLAVSAHLLGGMATLALLFWQWLSVRASTSSARTESVPFALSLSKGERGLKPAAGVALALLVVQIFLGGWTSSNYAALACPDLPTCHGVWMPETDWDEAFTLWRGLGTNYEFGVLDSRARVTIHFVHRLGALAVTGVFLGLVAMLWCARERPLALTVAAALTVQVAIGLSIVALQLPLALAAAHNAGAALLLLSLVAVNHHLRTVREPT